jgi:hypothetical protein
MSVGYEVGSSVTVRALHQMPVEGPEGELHPHDYRIDVVAGRRELDEHGMVCDLDALRAALQAIVARIDGKTWRRFARPRPGPSPWRSWLAGPTRTWSQRSGRREVIRLRFGCGSRRRTSAAMPGR